MSSSVYSQATNTSKHSSQVSSYMNKAKGGGYSKLAQAKNEAVRGEVIERMERGKSRERAIIQEKK